MLRWGRVRAFPLTSTVLPPCCIPLTTFFSHRTIFHQPHSILRFFFPHSCSPSGLIFPCVLYFHISLSVMTSFSSVFQPLPVPPFHPRHMPSSSLFKLLFFLHTQYSANSLFASPSFMVLFFLVLSSSLLSCHLLPFFPRLFLGTLILPFFSRLALLFISLSLNYLFFRFPALHVRCPFHLILAVSAPLCYFTFSPSIHHLSVSAFPAVTFLFLSSYILVPIFPYLILFQLLSSHFVSCPLLFGLLSLIFLAIFFYFTLCSAHFFFPNNSYHIYVIFSP